MAYSGGFFLKLDQEIINRVADVDLSGWVIEAAGASRAFGEYIFAVLIFVLLALPMFVVMALVYLTDPGPVLFVHRRIGKNGRPFKCYKFRSMCTDADAQLDALLRRDVAAREEWATSRKLRHDPRITKIGKFLRQSSLDELPQIFNVLNGTMSLVGPRPIVADEIDRFGRYYRDYCGVKPGITGLWQVSGRSSISYRRRIALDVVYARSRSVPLDAKILCRTIPSVLLARGSC